MYKSSDRLEICVGSSNPVKINAVSSTFNDVLRALGMEKDILVEGHDVASGVPNQPIGLGVIYNGAKNRANAVMEIGRYDYYVGLEAGIYHLGDQFIDLQFCVIIDNEGWSTVGHGGGFTYPKDVIRDVMAGEEVGEIFARMSGNGDIKKQEGAIGMLSRGILNRTEFSKQSVLMALIPRISPSFYMK